jgi:hypothetical protein
MNVTMGDRVRPWSVFASLIDVMPANSADAKRIQMWSAIMASESVVEKVALLLNKVEVAPLMVTPVGEKKWRVGFGSSEERDKFVAMGPVFVYKDVRVMVEEKLFRYVIQFPAVVGREELFEWFQQYFVESDVVRFEPMMVESIWLLEVKVTMRKMITGDVRVRVGIDGRAKCKFTAMNEQ